MHIIIAYYIENLNNLLLLLRKRLNYSSVMKKCDLVILIRSAKI